MGTILPASACTLRALLLVLLWLGLPWTVLALLGVSLG